MNWSAYSRYVGDVFGGPLAMEGLAAFFLESTFLGLWLFGWDRLPRRVHLFCIWMVALGSIAVGGVHHGRELVDAAPGRLRAGHSRRAAAAERHRRAVHQPGVPLGLLPRGPGRAGHRDARAAGGLGLAPAARASRPTPFRTSAALAISLLVPLSIALVLVGSQLGVIETTLPADEDRRRRGAVGDLPAVLVLGLPDRRRQATTRTRTKVIAIPHLLSILATLSLERRRSSGSTSCRRSTSSSTGRATTSRTCSSSTGRCA